MRNKRLAIVSAFLISAFCLLPAAFTSAGAQVQEPSVQYAVHAIRFASVPYAESNLVAGGDRRKLVDLAFTFWVAQAGARNVMVDAGFYRDKFINQWKPRTYVNPAEALETALALKPGDVTDIVVTHSHWDHIDGIDLFPNATVWIQREEYEYYVGPNGTVAHANGLDPDDVAMLVKLNTDGRVKFIDGDAREIIPGIMVYTGGKHTFASQYVGVQTRVGTVILASDNAYLYANLERHLAIAQTLDADSNLAAQTRMLLLAASPHFVVPGHDPAVFERFPLNAPGVARIDVPEK